MNERKKRAYRYLLYQAMSDLRHYEAANLTESPELLSKELQSVGGLAYWLQTLALSSSNNFVEFREDSFWRQMRHFDSKYPGLGLTRYKAIFEKELAATPDRPFRFANFLRRLSYSREFKSIQSERAGSKTEG